ncbi:MAG TPA: hypothetical protein DHW82_14195 [Spirochaetia bacterium]|nr:MAG: hypothetical protein A2Y41_00335 [Spirochaetes bacterium GWB1_36_13]HCL58141.1 hypothetical protein [Spirochaetia bacterium]
MKFYSLDEILNRIKKIPEIKIEISMTGQKRDIICLKTKIIILTIRGIPANPIPEPVFDDYLNKLEKHFKKCRH